MSECEEQVEELRARARAGIQPRIRFAMEIRYAREMGWLQVLDPFTGQWIEVLAIDCPPSWRRAAYAEKLRRKASQQPRDYAPPHTSDTAAELAF